MTGELWTEVHDFTGDSDQDHCQEKEKQNGCLRRLTNIEKEEKLKAKEKTTFSFFYRDTD